MPPMSPEELALFGESSPMSDDWLAVDETPAVSLSPVPTSTPTSDPALPPPPNPSRKLTIRDAPKCMSCGVELNAENGSKNRGGEWKHVGCPAVIPTPVPVPVLMFDAPTVEKPKRGRPTKVDPGLSTSHTPAPQPVVASVMTTIKTDGWGNTTVTAPVVYELGPQTLATLQALIAALSK